MEHDIVPDMVHFTILYTHGASQSVDHLYGMRDINKQYANKIQTREKKRNNIYI
jgi:hypothetical protein